MQVVSEVGRRRGRRENARVKRDWEMEMEMGMGEERRVAMEDKY